MPTALPIPPPGFDEMPIEEQIDYVQSLWDRIAATPDRIAVPDSHRQLLAERLKEYETNPDSGETWEAVKDRLEKKLRRQI